jgi:hypothetical protein
MPSPLSNQSEEPFHAGHHCNWIARSVVRQSGILNDADHGPWRTRQNILTPRLSFCTPGQWRNIQNHARTAMSGPYFVQISRSNGQFKTRSANNAWRVWGGECGCSRADTSALDSTGFLSREHSELLRDALGNLLSVTFKVTKAFEIMSERAAMLADVVDQGPSAFAGRLP